MVVGISEGSTWRCEVLAETDGYLVQVRDLQTSRVEASDCMLFRSAVTAFAYANFLAALDQTAAARLAGEETGDLETELDERRLAFSTIADQLFDRGIDTSLIAAWDDEEPRLPRHRLH
jgi:hypothetical protein